MAYVLTYNRDDALELVQDSMLRLSQHYAEKPPEQWKLLFYRILQNGIRDFHRRQSARRLFGLAPEAGETETARDYRLADPDTPTPPQTLEQDTRVRRVISAIKTLTLRQQQVFMLRAWQEFSVEETASTLSISSGSVKTHYQRAQQRLRKLLGDQDEPA